MTFWALSNLGFPYGQPSQFYAFHRGQDRPAAGGTWVPALVGGVVVAVRRTTMLGWTISIDTGLPVPIHEYSHVLPRVSVGDRVSAGDGMGPLAGWDTPLPDRGTAWTGPHVHLVCGYRAGVSSVTGWATVDPRPIIETILARPAFAGGIVPIERGPLMALSDDEQTELLVKTRAVYDALFKLDQVKSTGGSPLPGGVLRSLSVLYDALFKKTPISDSTTGAGEIPGGLLKMSALQHNKKP